MIFLQNKFFFNLYLRWHVLRSYRFVAEVTFKLFYLGSKKDTRERLIYAKLMIVFTPNVEFCFYFEVIHGYNFQANERLKKNTEKWSTIWCFWSFFRFLYSNTSGNKYHKQKWRVLFFTCIKLVARVLACARSIAHIKWTRLIWAFDRVQMCLWYLERFWDCINLVLATGHHYFNQQLRKNRGNPAGIYLLKFNNRSTRTRCEICSKLTIKTPERPFLYC